jgi:hypothetical protein
MICRGRKCHQSWPHSSRVRQWLPPLACAAHPWGTAAVGAHETDMQVRVWIGLVVNEYVARRCQYGTLGAHSAPAHARALCMSPHMQPHVNQITICARHASTHARAPAIAHLSAPPQSDKVHHRHQHWVQQHHKDGVANHALVEGRLATANRNACSACGRRGGDEAGHMCKRVGMQRLSSCVSAVPAARMGISCTCARTRASLSLQVFLKALKRCHLIE